MKYREASTLCIHGCGRPRRPGQRDCSVCHAEAMRKYRRKRSAMNPVDVLNRASMHLAQSCSPNLPRLEFKANMDARAILIAAQIDVLNRVECCQ
jgi:hypothetical protein